jgi:predicted ATPase
MFCPGMGGQRRTAVIRSVEIKGLRGIREGKLEDLAPLTILVGPNGSGKSTVLDALYMCSQRRDPVAAMAAARPMEKARRETRWLSYRSGQLEKLELGIAMDDGDEASVKYKITPDGRNLTRTESKVLTLPNVRLITSYLWESTPPLDELYTTAVENGRREEMNEIIREVVPGALHAEILTDQGKPVVHVVFQDHSVPAALVGDGVLAAIRLTIELAACRRGLVLLEEPEVHQHPRAIWQTARAVVAAARRTVQVVLTTHSLELIDALVSAATAEDRKRIALYRVVLDNGKLESSRLTGEDIAFARCQIEDDLR